MNIVDCIALIIVGLCVVAAVSFMVKQKKKGRCIGCPVENCQMRRNGEACGK